MCPLERKAFIWEQSKTGRRNFADLALYPEFRKELLRARGGGVDVCNSNRIINTLCIQAEQKLFALSTEICFYKSQVPPTFLICLYLITAAK